MLDACVVGVHWPVRACVEVRSQCQCLPLPYPHFVSETDSFTESVTQPLDRLSGQQAPPGAAFLCPSPALKLQAYGAVPSFIVVAKDLRPLPSPIDDGLHFKSTLRPLYKELDIRTSLQQAHLPERIICVVDTVRAQNFTMLTRLQRWHLTLASPEKHPLAVIARV